MVLKCQFVDYPLESHSKNIPRKVFEVHMDPKALFYLRKIKQNITSLKNNILQMFYLTFT